MLDNNTYNLMTQLLEEHKSLWRIKDVYKRDAEHCGECVDFWDRLEKSKEDYVRELEELIREHTAVKVAA